MLTLTQTLNKVLVGVH